MAGVSRQTVSRAVNGMDEIDATTRERVLDAVRALGYRPSRFARGLVRRGSITVGLVISELSNPYFPEVAAGVLDIAEQRGWQVVVTESRTDREKETRTLETLSYQVDAIIGHCLNTDDELARHTGGVPLVLLERSPEQTRFGSIGIDYAAGLKEGIAHLARAGHRRVGMLDGCRIDKPSTRRISFLAAARARRLTTGPSWIAGCGAHTVEAGEKAMMELLDARPAMTAVFGFNDLIAVGAMRAARRRGLRVPDDIAVLGFDGLALGELVEPPLTTLAIDKRALGRLAVEQVARMLAGRPPSTGRDAWVRPELVVRGSV